MTPSAPRPDSALHGGAQPPGSRPLPWFAPVCVPAAVLSLLVLVLVGCQSPSEMPRALDAQASDSTAPTVAPLPKPIEKPTEARFPSLALPRLWGSTSPLPNVLAYADRLRTLSPAEVSSETARLADVIDPVGLTQQAFALAATRSSGDLTRAIALMQRVAGSGGYEAAELHPLARVMAARWTEQRRVEDERDRLAPQLKDAQKRNDQMSERIEALRAIERSISRPTPAPPPPAPAVPLGAPARPLQ